MKYLSEYMEDAQTRAFNKYGAFWAFGTKQFEERRQPEVNYCNMGAGLICPVETAQNLADELRLIHRAAIVQDVEENGARGIISREYFNYETQVTCDRTNLMESMEKYMEIFPEQFTQELIDEVCKECFKQAIDNDWF
jgi:hypothetical protein